MLQLFGFDRIGVVLGDVYLIDPAPLKGQESPERGVRLEVRMLEPGTLPGRRVFDRALSGDPVAFVGMMLSDLEGMLERAGVEIDAALAADADKLRSAVPDVQRAVTAMLDQVKAGQLGTAPEAEGLSSARVSWL
jgi:hypothetical protein